MSEPETSADATPEFTESEIADYLREHPDFFERYPSLLLRMNMPHGVGNAAVSLVERQVSMLRQRNTELDLRLAELVSVAKLNDELVRNIIRLGASLLRVPDTSGRLAKLKSSLETDFSAEHAVLVLFEPGASPTELPAGFVLRIDRDHEALEAFDTFLRTARPRCGPITESQRKLVFGRGIKSAAFVPLGDGARLGFLVIGSTDPNYFHPTKRTDYLGRLGDLVAVAIETGQADGVGSQ